MTENVTIAVITLIGSGLGSLVGILASAKLTNYRSEQLEKKVDKHNTVVERTYKLEQVVCLLDERQEVANHRIKDLEGEVKK